MQIIKFKIIKSLNDVMKKTYIIPETNVQFVSQELPVASSSTVTGSNGIGYGGIDELGEKDPSVKENNLEFEW